MVRKLLVVEGTSIAMLECIVYKSMAIGPVRAESVNGLIRDARLFNERHGITGLLVYCDLKFMQLIEGEADMVASLYERIRQDRRHSNVRLLYRGIIARRLFPAWSMALRDANDVSEAERAHLSHFLDNDLEGFTAGGASEPPAMRLLGSFAETLRRRERIESALACLPS